MCTVASVLQWLGITVQLIDSSPERVQWAQRQDVPARRVDILSESVLDDLDLSGIGHLLIAVPDNEVASLVAREHGCLSREMRWINRAHRY